MAFVMAFVMAALSACAQDVVAPQGPFGRDIGARDVESSALEAGIDDGAIADASISDASRFDARAEDARAEDARPAFDARAAEDARPSFDARPHDDASFDGGPDVGSLDPGLSLPDPSGDPCFDPGNLAECPGPAVCRFFTPTEGRCESCSACGNLGARCSASDECDILFQCFRGFCVNFCQLGLQSCGADPCYDVGHPTNGVCPRP